MINCMTNCAITSLLQNFLGQQQDHSQPIYTLWITNKLMAIKDIILQVENYLLFQLQLIVHSFDSDTL